MQHIFNDDGAKLKILSEIKVRFICITQKFNQLHQKLLGDANESNLSHLHEGTQNYDYQSNVDRKGNVHKSHVKTTVESQVVPVDLTVLIFQKVKMHFQKFVIICSWYFKLMCLVVHRRGGESTQLFILLHPARLFIFEKSSFLRILQVHLFYDYLDINLT